MMAWGLQHVHAHCVPVTGELNILPKDAQPVYVETETLLDIPVQVLNHHAVLAFRSSAGKMNTSFYWIDSQVTAIQSESKGISLMI